MHVTYVMSVMPVMSVNAARPDTDAASTEDSVHSGISHAGIEESGYSGRVSHASTSSGVPPADQPVLGQEYAGQRGRAASSDTSASEQVRKIEQETLALAASTNGGGAGGARAGAGAGAGDASPDVTRTCDPEASVASAGGMSFASAADKDTTIKHTDKDTDKDTDTDTDKNTDKDTGKDTDKDRRVSAVDDNVRQDGDSPLEHLVFSWEALYKAHKEGPGGVLGEEEVRVMMEILVGKYSLMLSFLGLLYRLHDTLQQVCTYKKTHTVTHTANVRSSTSKGQRTCVCVCVCVCSPHLKVHR